MEVSWSIMIHIGTGFLQKQEEQFMMVETVTRYMWVTKGECIVKENLNTRVLIVIGVI